MSVLKTCKSLLFKGKPDLFYRLSRHKSCLGLWAEDITTDIKLNIERHWSPEVLANDNKTSDNENKLYILSMFPYPSGNLHMGHVRVYSISDSIARIQKLQGNDVIHPIGWDAFGLPAENAAIERNILPQIWTDSNIGTMKKQLLQLGLNFDWDREISTCNPDYYKWTQYIFLKLFDNGLAYQSKAKVNWDPVDNTVLADEQVDDYGCSWRSGAKVEKKTLTQWFIKTTKYAKQLYDGLNSDTLENWKDIINLQKHWIGECDGVVVSFNVKIKNTNQHLDIWSSKPYKFIHGDFIVIKKDNVMLQDLSQEEINNLKFFNPVTENEMSVYVTDEVNFPEGRDVYIACPTIDADDFKLLKSLNVSLEIKSIDIDISAEDKRAVEVAQNKNCGGHFVSSKLKDWLISRQRYWGTPIPIIHCPSCGTVPVPYKDLPVVLPKNTNNESVTLSLSTIESWVNCKCPQCSGSAKRECDTMDTFVDSSWYYYRYLDAKNKEVPFDKEKLAGVTPVSCYIGGKEHAVLHLYYARFMSHFLHSINLTPTPEPFKKLLVQGMIMGQSYKVKSTGKYLAPEDVEKVDKSYKEKATGESVLAQWEKMSKSKFNGENPQRLLTKYGCDTTRLLILSDVPPETSRKWSDATLPGVLNWQHRLWMTIREFLKHRNNNELLNKNALNNQIQEFNTNIWKSRNYFVATATYHFLHTQKLSVGISRLQSLTNVLRNNVPPAVVANSKEYELALANLIIMLSPITPHFCSELWSGFLSAPHRVSDDVAINWNKNVLQQKWPSVDSKFPLSFLCKVDGTDRCDLKIEANELNVMTKEKAIEIMLKEKSVTDRIGSDITITKYELYPECRALLHIFTKRSTKMKKNKKDEELQRSQG